MNTNQFSLANRKQLADLLADKYDGLRHKAKQKLRAKHQALQTSIIQEFAEKTGALKLAESVKVARDKHKELEVALTKLGFDLGSDDSVTLAYHEGRKLREKVDVRVEKELGTTADIDARFDSTQLAMMTVASLEDAEKLLRAVSEI